MMQILADRLLLQRKRSGLSQGEVKERTGLASSTISSYENGTSEPNASALVSLAYCYGCTVHYLLGLDTSVSALNTDGLDDIEIAMLEENIQVLRRAKGHPHTLKLFSYATKKNTHLNDSDTEKPDSADDTTAEPGKEKEGGN